MLVECRAEKQRIGVFNDDLDLEEGYGSDWETNRSRATCFVVKLSRPPIS
jgi:hypothetical protein